MVDTPGRKMALVGITSCAAFVVPGKCRFGSYHERDPIAQLPAKLSLGGTECEHLASLSPLPVFPIDQHVQMAFRSFSRQLRICVKIRPVLYLFAAYLLHRYRFGLEG